VIDKIRYTHNRKNRYNKIFIHFSKKRIIGLLYTTKMNPSDELNEPFVKKPVSTVATLNQHPVDAATIPINNLETIPEDEEISKIRIADAIPEADDVQEISNPPEELFPLAVTHKKRTLTQRAYDKLKSLYRSVKNRILRNGEQPEIPIDVQPDLDCETPYFIINTHPELFPGNIILSTEDCDILIYTYRWILELLPPHDIESIYFAETTKYYLNLINLLQYHNIKNLYPKLYYIIVYNSLNGILNQVKKKHTKIQNKTNNKINK